ncbi:hypothetical protein FHY52_12305 [Nocardia nova]|uniref:hypothetical protein n=1 Tax=Nocardia nova TaxID=37330 RepID=UPI0025B0A453|nr:hypothetical protein [Nocardia nova]MDN2497460.1 hypothetical protein [Nocardia nova]
MTDDRSERSFRPLTSEHLSRLALLAESDHSEFCRNHPEWAADLLACCVVQGGARHYLRGDRGIKDLDLYLFYALPVGRTGAQFPWNRYPRRRDFGTSELGRQLYTDADRANPQLAKKMPLWEEFAGRRVDLMSRAIAMHPDGPRSAVRDWLAQGARRGDGSAWHLSRTPVISLFPVLGDLWWTGADHDEAGIDKGLYGTL